MRPSAGAGLVAWRLWQRGGEHIGGNGSGKGTRTVAINGDHHLNNITLLRLRRPQPRHQL